MWHGPTAPTGRNDLEFIQRMIKTGPGSTGIRVGGGYAMKKDGARMDPPRFDVEP